MNLFYYNITILAICIRENNMKERTIVVVGAGPAGLMAAISASQNNNNNRVIVVEKNSEAGKKLLLTGGGRCNVTNNCNVDQLIKNTVTNGKFLFSCFNIFNNDDLMKFFENYGLKLKIEEDGKVFPNSDKARDVLKILLETLESNGVKIWYESEVEKIDINENGISEVRLRNKKNIKADSVIIATGGMSYPKTGSTGDGYKIVKELGHSVVDIKPGLVPIEIKEGWIKSLMGISLESTNIVCNVKDIEKPNKKPKTIKWTGPLIFTHYGISGPAVLNISSYLNKHINDSIIDIIIDIVPNVSEQELENILVSKEFEKNETIFKTLSKFLPKNLVTALLDVLELNKDKKLSDISKEESNKIITNLKTLKLTPKGLRSISEAIITSGGISTKEIDPKTMASKLVKGLYFAGEIIDVDAITGGYNLQIAFTTGYVAGLNA